MKNDDLTNDKSTVVKNVADIPSSQITPWTKDNGHVIASLFDKVICETGKSYFDELSNRLSTPDITRKVEYAFDQLNLLKGQRMPDFDNKWVALCYYLWYQPRQINMAYNSINLMLNKEDINIGKNLYIVDFACGSLAMQFGVTLAVADILHSGGNIEQIRIDCVDTSKSMIYLGVDSWNRFCELVVEKDIKYLKEAIGKISYNTYSGSLAESFRPVYSLIDQNLKEKIAWSLITDLLDIYPLHPLDRKHHQLFPPQSFQEYITLIRSIIGEIYIDNTLQRALATSLQFLTKKDNISEKLNIYLSPKSDFNYYYGRLSFDFDNFAIQDAIQDVLKNPVLLSKNSSLFINTSEFILEWCIANSLDKWFPDADIWVSILHGVYEEILGNIYPRLKDWFEYFNPKLGLFTSQMHKQGLVDKLMIALEERKELQPKFGTGQLVMTTDLRKNTYAPNWTVI